eukprot:CAMPEP_0175055554 /NCGR_PEP_ID=MMETSP0052_2-20121109/10152_1 /TAXON_ID=51329 ORGANISM="Polytomella parva, Strain SAG 63-3" /NCGR_SAMPLE_ID=MMETSP0052_2 /ASSEMBLY_ACC=CAM_ASM_000194 /LENGTH=216 /DNA_ID=CAMNT_0016320427 /DNA_START=333 /DNA_END=983 /DNA_ORIENTATION=+
MAFAMVGAEVILTDTADVLDKLRINCNNNLSPAAVRLAKAGHRGHGSWADFFGSIQVNELDWTRAEEHIAKLEFQPPVDFVLAADCIYREDLTEAFYDTVRRLTNEKSTVVVCNEFRSKTVHDRFMELFKATHNVKLMTKNKMDPEFWHPNIHIYVMKRKKNKQGDADSGGEEENDEEEKTAEEGTAKAPEKKEKTKEKNKEKGGKEGNETNQIQM